MSCGHYILNECDEPEICEDISKWAKWMNFSDKENKRVVAQDKLFYETIFVSTVFLGIDHNFRGSGPPVLWETMVFDRRKADGDKWQDLYQERYTSKADALIGHEKALSWAKEKFGVKDEVPGNGEG